MRFRANCIKDTVVRLRYPDYGNCRSGPSLDPQRAGDHDGRQLPANSERYRTLLFEEQHLKLETW